LTIAQGDKEDLETAELFAPLLKIRGWHAFMALLDKHIFDEQLKVQQPCRTVDEMIALESHKGALIGLRLARGIVPTIIAHADEIRKRMSPEEHLD
jgi:hypothetical protein